MSILKTYDRPMSLQNEPLSWPFFIVDDEGIIQVQKEENGILTPDPVFAPGAWVVHQTLGGKGMIIAVNDEQMTILWSLEPRELGDFKSIAFPLVRRVFPPALAPQLISIQPMTAPVGAIFYMDYQYGGDKRCTTGPWVSRMFWRAVRCLKTRTQSLWSSLSSWRPWRSGKKSTIAASETLNVDRQKQLLQALLQDPVKADNLVKKWSNLLPPSGPNGSP